MRVLLAEDNPVNQRVAQLQLRKLGFQADAANNGAEAVSLWERGGHSIILMDCQMPDLDGYEATQRIRAIESEKHLPRTRIIAMTANAMKGDRELCLAAGMDDYVAKPIEEDALIAVLDRSISHPEDASRQEPAARFEPELLCC